MGEYALVTAMVATIALAIGTIPDALLAKRLPTTAAKAQTLIATSARAQKLPAAKARSVMAGAPYPRAPLRYLFAEGWLRGTKDRRSCVLATAAPGATTRNIAAAIRRDRALVTRLGRMKVTVEQAAGAVLRGTASAC
jgi:hypothetical protein